MPAKREGRSAWVGYLRVSTPEQAERDLSLPAQRRAVEEYATRNGRPLAHVYVEEGCSGTHMNRRAFREMLEDVFRRLCPTQVNFRRSRGQSIQPPCALPPGRRGHRQRCARRLTPHCVWQRSRKRWPEGLKDRRRTDIRCFHLRRNANLLEFPKPPTGTHPAFCLRHVITSTRYPRSHLDDYAALHPTTVPAATIEED